MIEEDNTDIISIDELCEILMIGRNTAYRLLKNGEMNCFRIGRDWKIPRESVSEYIRRQSKRKA